MSQEQSASEQNSTGSIDTNQAGSIFAGLISPEARDTEPPAGQEEPKKDEPAAENPLTEEEALERAAAEEAKDAEPAQEANDDAPVKFTVKVDGKDVELTPEQIAEAYKSGMRQADYTRKTTETAQQRKAAEAAAAQAAQEAQAARADRMTYAQNLQALQAQMQSVLQNGPTQVDMDRLSVENPAEYVKQLHLLNQRQAALARVQQEQHRIAQQNQAEQARAAQEAERAQAKAREDFTKEQQEKLLAKLPDWKDSAKAQAEQASIAKYLEAEGYTAEEIQGVNDHRAVLLARKAMQYDRLMAKAKAVTSKVDKLPAKVERPGTATSVDPTDGRTAAMQRLNKTGSVEDAASIFAAQFK